MVSGPLEQCSILYVYIAEPLLCTEAGKPVAVGEGVHVCVCVRWPEGVWGQLWVVVGEELQEQVGQEGLTCQNRGHFFGLARGM